MLLRPILPAERLKKRKSSLFGLYVVSRTQPFSPFYPLGPDLPSRRRCLSYTWYQHTSSYQCVLRHDLHYTPLSFCGTSLRPKFKKVRECPALHAYICHAHAPSKITLPFLPTRRAVPRGTLVISVQLARDRGLGGFPVYQAKAVFLCASKRLSPT